MSPAGYWPQLRAAVEAGADAVYFGLKHFTARAKVGFSLEELPDVMAELRSRGVRGYVTFNTLVFQHELKAAAQTIAKAAEAGVDALIIQDPGALRLAREIAPELELHASTQMSITDSAGVRFALGLGVQRVTLARELSLEEIGRIHRETGAELEMFVHGALCVAYSGQCFSSEAWGGRSANRGQCAQACRMEYEVVVDGASTDTGDARYPLSPGDLHTLHHVPAIIAAGVGALKIEGRYKDSDYVALATNAYRKAVDESWAGRTPVIDPAEELRLEQVYSRGLGAHFVLGTDHQAVVRGRGPRHRGVLMGRVVAVEPEAVVLRPSDAHTVAPLKAGDGVVFDAADWRSPTEPEEGGRVYGIRAHRGGNLELAFGNRAIRYARIRPGDLVWRTDDPTLVQAVRPFTEAAAPVRRQPVSVRVVAKAGQPLESEWWLLARPEITISVKGSADLTPARNAAPITDAVRDQFGRLGNTAYELASLELDTDGPAPFLPASTLNQMRRDAVSKLQALQSTLPVRLVNNPEPVAAALDRAPHSTGVGESKIHLLVRTVEQLEAALDLEPASITLDYLDLYGLRPSVERVKSSGITVRVATPRVLKPAEARIVDFLVSLDCQILVRASGILQTLAARPHPVLIGDFSLNTANSASADLYLDMGISRLTPGHDLNADQVSDLARRLPAGAIEVVAYHHLPVFHTEHCVFCRFLSTGTSYRDCGRPCEKHQLELQDRSGRRHPVMADVGCRNTVFGAEAQEASAHMDHWVTAGIADFRLEFAHETGRQVRQVVELFGRALAGRISFPELGRELKRVSPGGTTQGSLFVAPNHLELPILQ